MHITIPFDVEVNAKGSSKFTKQQINERLYVLSTEPISEKRDEEMDYLLKLRQREFGE